MAAKLFGTSYCPAKYDHTRAPSIQENYVPQQPSTTTVVHEQVASGSNSTDLILKELLKSLDGSIEPRYNVEEECLEIVIKLKGIKKS
jgi:hypothetical protein